MALPLLKRKRSQRPPPSTSTSALSSPHLLSNPTNVTTETVPAAAAAGAEADDAAIIQAIFRRHFEARFAPLAQDPGATAYEQVDLDSADQSEEGDSSEEEEDWAGIVDEGDGVRATEVEIATYEREMAEGELSRAEMRAFMVWGLASFSHVLIALLPSLSTPAEVLLLSSISVKTLHFSATPRLNHHHQITN